MAIRWKASWSYEKKFEAQVAKFHRPEGGTVWLCEPQTYMNSSGNAVGAVVDFYRISLSRLLVIVENYPQLKANEQFNRLMDELSGTENRLAVERMRYNERVQAYNTSRRQFPGVITAHFFNFKDYPLFEAPTAAQQVPKVDFQKK